MNKDFNSKKERYNTIRKLCKMDLKHRRKLAKIVNIIDSNQNIFKGLAGEFVYEMFSLDAISDTILDLFLIPKTNYSVENNPPRTVKDDEQTPDEDLFCRDYYEEIWDSYVHDKSEEIDYDIIIDSYIEVMEREKMEIDIRILHKEEKIKE